MMCGSISIYNQWTLCCIMIFKVNFSIKFIYTNSITFNYLLLYNMENGVADRLVHWYVQWITLSYFWVYNCVVDPVCLLYYTAAYVMLSVMYGERDQCNFNQNIPCIRWCRAKYIYSAQAKRPRTIVVNESSAVKSRQQNSATTLQNCIDLVLWIGQWSCLLAAVARLHIHWNSTKRNSTIWCAVIANWCAPPLPYHLVLALCTWRGATSKRTEPFYIVYILYFAIFTSIERGNKLKIPFRLNDKWFTWSNDHQ